MDTPISRLERPAAQTGVDVAKRSCPQCKATTEGSICPTCGAAVTDQFSSYPRDQGLVTGVAAYGPAYRAVAAMYGLMPALAAAYSVSAFWKSLVIPVTFGSSLLTLGFMSTQCWAALALWRGRQWGKFFAGIHAFVMLVFMVFFFSQTVPQLSNSMRSWQETMAFVLAFGETLMTLGVMWQVARARRIDRDLASRPKSLP